MKLLSINNSCYSSIDNKYNKRSKPAVHSVSQQKPTINNNNKSTETQCVVSSVLNSAMSTQNVSRIPTNAFSTLSPKNQSASSFTSLPSLLTPTSSHQPASVSLRYNGYNHDTKIVFGNNVINPLNKKRIQLSPHQIKYNLTTKQMPEDVYGKKIVDVIYKVVNSKNESDKGKCRLNCEIKTKYMSLYEKVMSSVMKHCVEFRNKNNVEIGRAVIEGLYDEEIKKMKCNTGEYSGNVYSSNGNSIHNTINTNNYFFYETDGTSIATSSVYEGGCVNDKGNVCGNISLINEKSAELETSSYDNKGKAALNKNSSTSMQVDDKVEQNGKCKLSEIQRIKERMKLFKNGRDMYNDLNSFVFGLNTTRNTMNMKHNDVSSEHEKQLILHNILFKKEQKVALNRNDNNNNSHSNKIHSHYNSLIMSGITNDEVNHITTINKSKSVVFINGNSNNNSNAFTENQTKELSTKERHNNSTIQHSGNVANNEGLLVVTQEVQNINVHNKDEKLFKNEQSNNSNTNVKKYLDINNNTRSVGKFKRKNYGKNNTKLKEYNNWVAHNRNDNGFLNEYYSENVLLGMSNQHDQSTKEETNAAFFNIKKNEDKPMKRNDIIKNKIVSDSTSNNKANDINHSKSKNKSKHNTTNKNKGHKKEISLQINNQFLKNDNSLNKTLQKFTASNKQESTDENIRKSFYRNPTIKKTQTNTNTKPIKPKPKRSKISSRIKPIQLRHCKTAYYSFINKNLLLKQITYKSSLPIQIQLSHTNIKQGKRALSAKHPVKFTRKFKKLKLGLLHSSLCPKDYLNYSISNDSLSVSSVSSLMSISFNNDNNNTTSKCLQNNDNVLQLRTLSHKKAKHGKDFFNMKSVSKFINYRANRRYPMYKTNRQRSTICKKEEIEQEKEEEIKEQKTQLQKFMEMINKAKDQGTEVYIKELTEFFDGEFVSSDIYKAKILEERMNKFKADLRSKLDMKKEMTDNIMKGIQFKDVCLFQNKSVIT